MCEQQFALAMLLARFFFLANDARRQNKILQRRVFRDFCFGCLRTLLEDLQRRLLLFYD